jgi:hypothetical protein
MATLGEVRRQARGSTPLLPRAFLDDHASDEDSSLVVPLAAIQVRTISTAWIVLGNYFFEWWIGHAVYGVASYDDQLVVTRGAAQTTIDFHVYDSVIASGVPTTRGPLSCAWPISLTWFAR